MRDCFLQLVLRREEMRREGKEGTGSTTGLRKQRGSSPSMQAHGSASSCSRAVSCLQRCSSFGQPPLLPCTGCPSRAHAQPGVKPIAGILSELLHPLPPFLWDLEPKGSSQLLILSTLL